MWLGAAVLAVMASTGAVPGRAAAFVWNLPVGFPEPRVPPDNPMTVEKVVLGRHLFYDTRLSSDGTFACATCHQQARAFADDKARGVGVTGEVHPRGPISLTNVAYSTALTWANPTVRRLEEQALVPMFGTDPVELGLRGNESLFIGRLRTEPRYQRMFPAAFPSELDPFTVGNITRAIAAFERTLLSGRSPYDRYRTTMDARAIPAPAHHGEDLFFSERLSCFKCHGGFNFSQAVESITAPPVAIEFHNNGLYNVDGKGGYPPRNTGVHEVTRDPRDMGRFKPPTLRNIALTAPYMHDGSVKTLDAVIAHYEKGGTGSPLRSEHVKGFTLTADEHRSLIAFLESLTDTAFTTDAELSDPWRGAGPGLSSSAGSPAQAPRGTRPSIPAPRSIDFDGALRGLSIDPLTTDVTRGVGSGPAGGNGMPDSDELALVAAILVDESLDLRASGGIDHRTAQEAFRQARSTAIDDIRILSAVYPTAADVIAGYAMLGRRSFDGYVASSKELGPKLKGDYSIALALERFLGFDGDADGDGVANSVEYRATISRGRQAYLAAALDPTVRPSAAAAQR